MAGGKPTDEPKIKVYDWGAGGVQLVKDSLQLADNELTQAQNAEIVPDANKGGVGSLSKRGGLAALTSALAGSILGAISLPLQSTFVRTLYCSLGNFDTDRFLTTTDGVTWVANNNPTRAMDIGKLAQVYKPAHRIASYKNRLFYLEDDYTIDLSTPANGTTPALLTWDGAAAHEILQLTSGPSSDGNAPFYITDWLVANDLIYFATREPANTSNYKGRVLSLNPFTGQVKQVAGAFGDSPHYTGGYPISLAFYQGQLFAGLARDSAASTNAHIVRCYPDIDTEWTADTATLPGYVASLKEFRGELYAGLHGENATDVTVYRRTAASGTWTVSDSGPSTSGIHHFSCLEVYNDELYGVVYSNGGTDQLHVRKFDGSSWSTDHDLVAEYSITTALLPVNAVVFNGKLIITFMATGDVNEDGFILTKTTSTWARPVTAANIAGQMAVLVERT